MCRLGHVVDEHVSLTVSVQISQLDAAVEGHVVDAESSLPCAAGVEQGTLQEVSTLFTEPVAVLELRSHRLVPIQPSQLHVFCVAHVESPKEIYSTDTSACRDPLYSIKASDLYILTRSLRNHSWSFST